ncbi:MAG TPA: L-histidine N(alpha)-methyltransferase, partial [Allosphingosinicella sp.]
MTAPHDRSARACDARATTSSGPDAALRAEVLRGLTTTPKTLPPKLFYDATGAVLFERITELP